MAETLKKVIKVTLDATKTVVVACSSTTIDTTNDTILSDGHGFVTGDVVSVTTSVALPTGLAVNTAYYVREYTHDKFYLYDTYAHAVDLTATTGIINITATGSGNMTIRKNGYGVSTFGEFLPVGAIVTGIFTKAATAFTSSGTTNIAIGNGTDALVSAVDITTFFGTTSTYIATLATATGVPVTANTNLTATLSNAAALTNGLGDIYIEYVY